MKICPLGLSLCDFTPPPPPVLYLQPAFAVAWGQGYSNCQGPSFTLADVGSTLRIISKWTEVKSAGIPEGCQEIFINNVAS